VIGAATDAFQAAWGLKTCPRATLVKIELTVPSSRTLRFSSTELHTPDGSTWQAGLMGGSSIRSSVDWLAPGLAPASTSIRLAKRRDASQTSGTIHDLLPAFLFQNAIVTIYLWAPDMGLAWSDALQVFKGKVSRPKDITPEGITLDLLQDQSWNFQLPPVVDKTNYPDSPDVSQGLPVPIVYGDHSAPGLPAPWATPYGSKKDQEDSGAGSGVVPLVLVDAGVGAASVKVVGACHDVMDLLDRANGLSAFIAGGDILHPLDTAGGITETLGASESYLSIPDEKAVAFAAIIPIDVRAAGGGNTAGNPRRAMSPDEPATFADLDQATGKNELQLIIPNTGPLGRIESVEILVAYKGNAGNGNNLRANVFTPGGGAGASPVTWVSTGTSPAIQRAAWPAAYWNQDWAFGTNPATGAVYDLRIDFTGGATNKASIYWPVLVVKYRPQRSVVTPGKTYVSRVVRNPNTGPRTRFGGYTHYSREYATVEPTYRLDGQFYGNFKGYKDDGGGGYTGTAGALIQRPPDIMRHFLITWGGVSSGNVEYGTNVVGSFKDARDLLRNAQPNDMKLACWIGERGTVQRVLQKMSEQSGMCVYQDRFTDKWLAFVWKPGAAEDYGYKFSWYDIDGVSAEEITVVDTRRAIRVLYGFDHFRSRTLFEAFVNAAGSSQGVNLPTIRDQRLTASASNNKIDFSVGGGGAVTATLTNTTYSPIDLAEEARIRCRAAATNNVDCGYGFDIKAGFNDLLDFKVHATSYQATLNPGSYTAEGLAAEFARAMNAVGSAPFVYACTYGHATNKFTVTATPTVTVTGVCNNTIGTNTITRLTGSFLEDGVEVGHYVTHPNFGANTYVTGVTALTVTCSGVSALGFANDNVTWEPRFSIDGTTGAAGYTTSAAHVMGHVSLAVTPAVSVTAEVERYADRFWFSYGVAASNINMLWGSGTNVATNAAHLLGYDRADSGTTRYNPAKYSRGDRERTAATLDGYYDPREETQFTADWIRDEATAVEKRNRHFDLTAKPRVCVPFRAFHPGVRVMQVIELRSDVDPHVVFPRYGSGGSWAGKTLRVLEVEQGLGPNYATELLAMEA